MNARGKIETPAAADPYGHPGFDPVQTELRGVALAIEGELPPELDGVFLRNGTNARFAPRRRRHMFDGEAMLHMVELRGGEARYSNTYIRTPRSAWIEREGRNPFMGIADLTSGGKGALAGLMVERLKVRFGLLPRMRAIEAGSNGTAVLHHDDRLYALQETALPFRLDIGRDTQGWLTLDGRGTNETFGGSLDCPFSAHPKTDSASGTVYSIGQDFTSGTTHLTRLERGDTITTSTVMQGKPAAFFVHDYILTDTHIIFPDSSLRFNPAGLAGPDGSVASFDDARPLRFGMIARDHATGDPVRWFETGLPGHIWHIANGWEADGAIHVYAPVFRDYPPFMPIHTPAEPHTQFVHWRLDLASGAVRENVLLDHHYERPGIDWRRHGQPARYTWLLDESGGVMGKGVLKYDLFDRREAGYLDYDGLLGGEPVFIPRGDGTDEDDGWLVDLLADGTRAVLIVADAATMTERCRITLPQPVPFGVHALWLDRAATDALIAD
ncbi:MAG: carotenoid oxygenase family protein [Porphyrobacter sp.]|nr:carotenoid oxygenase family protein [Porphyrobacter sp.]